jgi:hypothetical protein
MSEARRCAGAILEIASRIRAELPDVSMSDALRVRTEQVCSALVGTKHDVVSELFEMDELVGSDAHTSTLVSRMRRLVRWLGEDVDRVHELVTDLEAAADREPGHRAAYVPISGSAAGVREAFEATRAAVAGLERPQRG